MMPESPWNIVFFGSAEFSLPALRALAKGPDAVALVVSPPPAPAGRGRKLTPSPVALLAEELGIAALEAKNFKELKTLEAIRAARPDLLVVAAYGGFLPKTLLELCPFPPLNIHPSLLPRHRGAAPVNWSLINGDAEVGVSIIFLEKEMDAGPVLAQKSFNALCACKSAGEWEAQLAQAGAEMLMESIARLKRGDFQAVPQNSAKATINRLLTKDDGQVDWAKPAAQVAGLINGVDPWPGARTNFQGKSVKLYKAAALPAPVSLPAPGRVLGLAEDGRLLAAAADALVAVAEVQPEGKKRMKAADFWRGYRPESFE